MMFADEIRWSDPSMTLRDLMGHEDAKPTQRYVTAMSADKRKRHRARVRAPVGNPLPAKAEDPRSSFEKL